MKYSGLYLITNPSTRLEDAVNTVSTLVQAHESNQSIIRHKPWRLSYHLFRDTIPRNHALMPDADGNPQPYPHLYLHLLHQSTISRSLTFTNVQPAAAGSPPAVCSIAAEETEDYASLHRVQFAAEWTQRHVLAVPHGVTFEGGPFTVQIGELRTSREAGGAVASPGVVVCISTVVGTSEDGEGVSGVQQQQVTEAGKEEEEIDLDCAQASIRAFWNNMKAGMDLGRAEVKEVMMNKGYKGRKGEQETAVQMWCEALRMRG